MVFEIFKAVFFRFWSFKLRIERFKYSKGFQPYNTKKFLNINNESKEKINEVANSNAGLACQLYIIGKKERKENILGKE